MAGSWTQSRTVTKQAWGVIKENPYMLLFPVVSGILAILAFLIVAGIGLAVMGVTTVEEQTTSDEVPTSVVVIGVLILVIAAYLATLITQIFMGGLVKCTDEELQGRDSGFGAGLRASFSRLGALMGWAGIRPRSAGCCPRYAATPATTMRSSRFCAWCSRHCWPSRGPSSRSSSCR